MRHEYRIELEQGSMKSVLASVYTAPPAASRANLGMKRHASISEALAWAAEVIRREEER